MCIMIRSKKKMLLCIGMILLLSSCNFSREMKNGETSLAPVDSMCSVIGLPTGMKLFDGKLFLVDMFNGESLISVFDLKTKQNLISFGKRGNGPEEFLHISNIDFKRNADNQTELLVFDPAKKKCHLYDYQELLNGRISESACLNVDDSAPSLHELHKLDNGYIATGKIDENKYVRLSESLKPIDYIGSYRPKPFNAIPDAVHRQANNGKTEFSQDKKGMVEIVYNASVLSYFEVGTEGLQKKWEYMIDELDYEVVDGSIVNKSVVGYLSAYVGQKSVYALYSGEKENLGEIATYGTEIHVFDYDGKMVDKIKLERSAFLISVDEANKKIYTLSHVPETVVLIYDYN